MKSVMPIVNLRASCSDLSPEIMIQVKDLYEAPRLQSEYPFLEMFAGHSHPRMALNQKIRNLKN